MRKLTTRLTKGQLDNYRMDYFAGNREGMDSFDQRKQDLAKQIAEKWMERGFTVDYLVMELHLDRKIIEEIFAGDVTGIEMKILEGIRAKIKD
ncbi:hypothetical protein AAHN97_14920 [Chitinophaga niabensis]|uniref:hypothetical protein n=1 Tax=Chitinophaga niabensis TaxID=536979 RepID=UPI0031BA5512